MNESNEMEQKAILEKIQAEEGEARRRGRFKHRQGRGIREGEGESEGRT